VLAARNSHWNPGQLDALLSPSSFTAALLPRQLLHSTLQKRLGQKLGAPRREQTRPSSGASVRRHGEARSRGRREPDESAQERQEDTSQLGHQSRAQTTLPGRGHARA
jgi:hypothetical protein